MEVRIAQLEAWRRELLAQAAVDSADDFLDDVVEAIARAILLVKQDRKDARFLRYFSEPPSVIIRMGPVAAVRACDGAAGGGGQGRRARAGTKLAGPVFQTPGTVTQGSEGCAQAANACSHSVDSVSHAKPRPDRDPPYSVLACGACSRTLSTLRGLLSQSLVWQKWGVSIWTWLIPRDKSVASLRGSA
jgi:hypothetical protein